MKTQLLTDTPAAAKLLQAGQLVAFPTETVFGVGADATNHAAVERLFEAKGRPSDNPLIVHLADIQSWRLAAREMTPSALILLNAFSPGPLTVVLPKHSAISTLVTAGLDTVAIRIPSCTTTRDLLAHASIPVAAPSANRSGKPSCTRWQSVLEDLDGRIDAILCTEASEIGLESTVVDCSIGTPVLLRHGAISLEDIRGEIPEIQTISESYPGCSRDGDVKSPGLHKSPGLRHPHYQPNARIELWESSTEIATLRPAMMAATAYCGLDGHAFPSQFRLYKRFDTLESYAANFYEFLRAADRCGAATILVQLAPNHGIGVALRDRQLRAAAVG